MNIAQEFSALFSVHGFLSLCILSMLELVLGFDNIIFISLVVIKLPESQRFSARVLGLALALVMRIVMLFVIVWLSTITSTLFSISNFNVSVRDVLFLVGGMYLIWNTYNELKAHIAGEEEKNKVSDNKTMAYRSVVLQIVLVDMIFSFDSIFTAIGLIRNFVIMSVAVAVGMGVMIWISGKTSDFINKNPTIKTLALCFILVVGMVLVANALHYEIPKGYFYAALGFGLVVELLNMRIRRQKH